MTQEPQLPQVGAIVADKYRVERVLGVGGMGTVLAVRHLALDEPRALKLMLPKGLELPQARERFFREARSAAKLRSEHAVKIHDVAVSPEGFPYIEMEMLDGADLATIVRRAGVLPIDRAVRWIAEACEPVGEAHALGIVHRDLKPGNLFLTRRRDGGDMVKVLDFGIAKTQQQLESDLTLTRTNASFGSPMYMSPEQMRGARFAEPRSDLWALGVVLYELVTGRRPFQAESATALALVVTNDEPAPPRALRPDLPASVEAVILRCLAKRPEGRFASAGELAMALREALPEAAPPRASMPSASQAFLGAPPSPFPFPVAPQVAGPAPASTPGLAAAQGGAAAQPTTPLLTPSAAGVALVASSSSALPASAAPSQPTVATLTTTVGRRAGSGGALVIGGAMAAAAVAGVLLFLLLRSPPGGGAAGSAPPAPAVESGPPRVAEASPSLAPEAPVVGSAGARPSAGGAGDASVDPAAPAPPSAPGGAEIGAAARSTSPAAAPPPQAPQGGSARPAPPPVAPESASKPPRRAKPKTGFGGID